MQGVSSRADTSIYFDLVVYIDVLCLCDLQAFLIFSPENRNRRRSQVAVDISIH